ncbi:unnamed protein product [Closterium sp. Naga37s-1]|nr:unnamed protein product [Closterium sp. Naga37s-1]
MAEETVVKKRKVMVALDGSEFSRQAFDFAVAKIFRPEKDLVVLFNVRAASGDEAPKLFPRIGTRDPYKRLGLGRDASTEEITEAKNYLVEEYKGHERSREAIEEAFDKIIAEKFRERRKSKINLKADLKKKVAEAPPWIQALIDMVDVPKPAVIAQRGVLFALIAVWSIMNPAEGGPAFQVAVALGLSVYLINERLKSITRALIIGFATLVVGWITGSFLVPFIPEGIFPGFWSLELGTSLVTYVFLWFSTTFLK